MAADVLAVGLTTLDILGRPIDALPANDEATLIEGIDVVPAGTAAGFALIAATLGASVGLVSAIGNDRMGRFVASELRNAGVDLTLTSILDHVRTSATILPVDCHSRRAILHAPGASMLMEIGPEAIEAVSRARFVHWAAIGARRITTASRDAFLQNARGSGAYVTCDLIAPASDAGAELAAIAPALDCFLPSLIEARFLTGHTDPEACARGLLALGIPRVIITLGGAGVLDASAHRAAFHPAFDVQLVDSTSCGDAFCAGLVAARAHGLPEEEQVRFASAAAALVAEGLGTLGKLQDFPHTLEASRAMRPRGDIRVVS